MLDMADKGKTKKKIEIGVEMFVNDVTVNIVTKVRSSHDEDGNLILLFSGGPKGSDRFKFVFNKQTYLDIEDE